MKNIYKNKNVINYIKNSMNTINKQLLLTNYEKLIIEKNNKKYFSYETINLLLGYKNDKNINFDDYDIISNNQKIHIFIDDAIKIIETEYNKRNPEIIDIHKNIGLIGEYSIEAKTLYEIINFLKQNNISFENQYVINSIKRRIDLYIPDYKICIECDEKEHINNLIDDELKNNQLISMGYNIIRYDGNNFNCEEVINQIKNNMLLFSTKINILDKNKINK